MSIYMAFLFLIAKKVIIKRNCLCSKKSKIINILDNELVKNSDIIKVAY